MGRQFFPEDPDLVIGEAEDAAAVEEGIVPEAQPGTCEGGASDGFPEAVPEDGVLLAGTAIHLEMMRQEGWLDNALSIN